MRRILALLFIPILGSVTLDEVMTREEKNRTGISSLNYTQKQELENWLNANFDKKENASNHEQLSLSLNIEHGSKLELSDGSTYLIDPEDRVYTVYWITPFPIRLGKSNDPNYPVKITNMNTGTSVNGKQISTREELQKEIEKQKQKPKPLPKQPPRKTPAKPKASYSPSTQEYLNR